MNRVVFPGALSGQFRAPASKSHAHRLLICAALGCAPVTVSCDTFSDDIIATIDCLNAMGAKVSGAGTDVIKVRGVGQLKGGNYTIIPDQIEAGSYMVAAAATGGDVLVKNVTPKHLEPITAKLRRAGIEVEEFDDAVRVRRTGDILPLKINTMPHPGFPTDMQPLMGVLLSVAKGTSTVTESVWDNRFRYVDELRKMGAVVQVDGQRILPLRRMALFPAYITIQIGGIPGMAIRMEPCITAIFQDISRT